MIGLGSRLEICGRSEEKS